MSTIADLEAYVDQHGMSKTLRDLSKICTLKAEHLRENWQDDVSAIEWENISTQIDDAVKAGDL